MVHSDGIGIQTHAIELTVCVSVGVPAANMDRDTVALAPAHFKTVSCLALHQ